VYVSPYIYTYIYIYIYVYIYTYVIRIYVCNFGACIQSMTIADFRECVRRVGAWKGFKLWALSKAQLAAIQVLACCSVLQRLAACCSVLQHVAACCSAEQCVAIRCGLLQYAAVCCSVAVCCSAQLDDMYGYVCLEYACMWSFYGNT